MSADDLVFASALRMAAAVQSGDVGAEELLEA